MAYDIPQVQSQIKPIKEDENDLANLMRLMLLQRRASRGSGSGSDSKTGDLLYAPTLGKPGEYSLTPIPGRKDFALKLNYDKTYQAGLQSWADALANDPDIRKELDGFADKSVKAQRATLDRIRTQILPNRLPPNIPVEDTRAVTKYLLGGREANVRQTEKAVEGASRLGAIVDMLKVNASRAFDVAFGDQDTAEQRLASAEKFLQERDAVIRNNPYLLDQQRRMEEGENFIARSEGTDWLTNIGTSAAEMLPGAGAYMASAAAGSALGSVIAPGPGTILGGLAGGMGAGAALAPGDLATIVAGRNDLTREQKLRVLEEGQLPAQLVGAASGAIPTGLSRPALLAANRALARAGVGSVARAAEARGAQAAAEAAQPTLSAAAVASAERAAAAASGSAELGAYAQRLAAHRAAELAAVEQTKRTAARQFIDSYFDKKVAQDAAATAFGRYRANLPYTAAELAAMNAGTVAGYNAIQNAYGAPTAWDEGLGDAIVTGIATAPLFGLMNTRPMTVPRSRPQGDVGVVSWEPPQLALPPAGEARTGGGSPGPTGPRSTPPASEPPATLGELLIRPAGSEPDIPPNALPPGAEPPMELPPAGPYDGLPPEGNPPDIGPAFYLGDDNRWITDPQRVEGMLGGTWVNNRGREDASQPPLVETPVVQPPTSASRASWFRGLSSKLRELYPQRDKTQYTPEQVIERENATMEALREVAESGKVKSIGELADAIKKSAKNKSDGYVTAQGRRAALDLIDTPEFYTELEGILAKQAERSAGGQPAPMGATDLTGTPRVNPPDLNGDSGVVPPVAGDAATAPAGDAGRPAGSDQAAQIGGAGRGGAADAAPSAEAAGTPAGAGDGGQQAADGRPGATAAAVGDATTGVRAGEPGDAAGARPGSTDVDAGSGPVQQSAGGPIDIAAEQARVAQAQAIAKELSSTVVNPPNVRAKAPAPDNAPTKAAPGAPVNEVQLTPPPRGKVTGKLTDPDTIKMTADTLSMEEFRQAANVVMGKSAANKAMKGMTEEGFSAATDLREDVSQKIATLFAKEYTGDPTMTRQEKLQLTKLKKTMPDKFDVTMGLGPAFKDIADQMAVLSGKGKKDAMKDIGADAVADMRTNATEKILANLNSCRA